MEKNAIILAAGKSNRFAPLTYEKPKGLFKVKGEILIERQINQLREAGIDEIILVVGYMKEKYFYLEEKYGIKLVVNNTFSNKGNLYSLYVARKYLKNTYICCSDHYFVENPFIENNEENISYRACAYQKNNKNKFVVNYSDANVITGFKIDSTDDIAMVGQAYFNEKFSKKICEFMENEIDDFGVSNLFWEEFFLRHINELTLHLKHVDENKVLEFDSIENLRQFDSEFLINIDSRIIFNICEVLKCEPNDIVNINVIKAGLTNVSFSFEVKGNKYVYRHPGGTAGNLVDRRTEVFAQLTAKRLGVDKSVIHIDETGWKLSHYVENIVECDFLNDDDQLYKGMEYIRRMQSADVDDTVKEFNTLKEAKKLMTISCAYKGNLFEEFAELIEKVERLNVYVENDLKQLGWKKVLCHNDTYEPNYIATVDRDLYLIDWEYAGVNDPANDLACILCRADYTKEEVEKYIRAFLDREPTYEEHRHLIAYIAICGFYWFCWGLYKGSVGDDDGFFFLPAYRNCKRYIDEALESYQ